ncbi:MAG TPA: hypothetical protein VFC41_07810, partial [Anaerovoracaceae bacterium]|nr:hypothetical protein [Anaerovoracaceae bacterium]
MIVYHKNNEVDREQWDNCIRNSPGVKPYAYSWYLDIMAPGWEALVDDDYDSVFPIPGFRRFGIQYVANPVFLQQLGAFSPDKTESKSIIEFLNYMPGFYRLIDLCVKQKIDIEKFKVTEKVNFELDISKSYEKIRDNFSPHCIRNIEASAKKKPELVSDVTPDEIIDLFIMNKGKEISGIKIRDYQRLKNLMNFCLKNKKGRIIGVRATKRRLIYGIFLVETPGNKTMLFVVNTPQSRERRIGYYMVNYLIKNHSSTRTILDFAGSSIPSIASFMESFGCVNVPYYRI